MSRRGLLRFVVLAGLALCSSRVMLAKSDAKLPDWVMAAAAEQTGPLPKTANAVVLYQDEVLTVAPDGKKEYRMRIAVKILRPPGRDSAVPFVPYDKDAPLKSFHVWAIGPDGRRFAMKKYEYVDLGDTSDDGILYADDRYRAADPPGADPGGVVAWEFVQKLPSYEKELTWNFQWAVPVVKATFELVLPPGWSYATNWFRHAAIAPVKTGPNAYEWEADHVPGIDLDNVPLAPSWEALAGRMVVHYSAKPIPTSDSALWAQIGQWYDTLAAGQTESGANIKTATAGLVPASADFMTRLQAVTTYLQQKIRYVGIEIGIGGLKPHSASEVFANQYGDCKDKATLLISMLDDVGIRATWVLVDTHRGFVAPDVPSIDGDHIIAAIQLPAGYENPKLKAVVTTKTGQRYLIFDPTNEFVPVGLLPGYEQGSWGLLVAGADSQVVHLPTLPPASDVTSWDANLKLAADGTLSGTAQVKLMGASSWASRDFYAKSTQQKIQDHMNAVLREDLNEYTLNKGTVENARKLDEPLSIDYQLTAPSYAQEAGSLLLVRPRVLGSVDDGLTSDTRKYPISFSNEGTWSDSINIALPAGYTVDDLPDPVHVDLGFADYSSQVQAKGGVLHYTREYVLKTLSLPAGDYAKLRKLEAAISSDESNTVVLKKE
jgi:hypothetical protein